MLGISPRDAADAVEKMKRTAAETISTHLLLTDPDHGCTSLAKAQQQGEASSHVARCEACRERRSGAYSPLQILSALRVVPAEPVDLAYMGSAVETTPLSSRLATPLGVLAVLAGALAIAAVGYLTWDNILEPIGVRLIEAARPSTVTTTVAPPQAVVTAVPVAARADSAQTSEDEPVLVAVLDNDGDVADDGALTVISLPDHGSAIVLGSGVLYTPDRDYNGADSFAYELVAGNGVRTSASVSLSIIPVDDVPLLLDVGALAGTEDVAFTIDIADLVGEVDGDTLQIIARDEASTEGGTISADLVYTPAPNFHGRDSFGLTVTDGFSDLAVPVLVGVASVNDLPLGPGQLSIATEEDVALVINSLAGWSDADGDNLVVQLVAATSDAGGAVVLRDAELTYTPPADFFGDDHVTYRVTDGVDAAVVSIGIAVSSVADPPLITRASFDVAEDVKIGTIIGTIRATDAEGDAFSFRLGQSTAVVSIAANGRVELIQTLDHEAADRIAISAIAVDATGASRRFEVVVRVGDIDEAPTGRDQQKLVTPFAKKGTPIGKVKVSDPEGAALKFKELNGDPSNAVAIDASTGALRTTKRADPTLYPLTLAIEATDPGGLSTVVFVVIRLDDFSGPEVGAVSVSDPTVWEQRQSGVECSRGTNRSVVTVAMSDPSGIASATIQWSATFDGVPLFGATLMALDDGIATGSFTFGAGLVKPGGQSILTASVVAVDRASNTTSSSSFTITVKSCQNG